MRENRVNGLQPGATSPCWFTPYRLFPGLRSLSHNLSFLWSQSQKLPCSATHDSKRFQELLCGSSNETSLSIFHWEDQCSPLCLLVCCQELFSLKSCLLQKLSCTTDQSMMSGCSDVMLISLGNFNCLPRAAVIYQLPPNDRRDLKWMGQLGTLLPCRTNLISCWDVIGWPSFHLVWHLV